MVARHDADHDENKDETFRNLSEEGILNDDKLVTVGERQFPPRGILDHVDGMPEKDSSMVKMVAQAQWSLESYSIGLKLRSLRTQKRLTLARLAAETGLSTALLSKLETDRMVPTLPTLATISRVYGVGMSYFFQEATRHTVSITRKAQLQGHERGPDQVRITPLNAPSGGEQIEGTASGGPHDPSARTFAGVAAGTKRANRLVAQLIEFAPLGAASIPDSIRKSCAVLYVLDGRLQLDSGGMHEFLETGDCVYVDTDMTMAWSAAGKHRCRIMAVFPGAEAEAES